MEFQDVFTVHGAAHISNTGGIEIELHPSGDGLRYRLNYGQDLENEPIIEAEIEYLPNPDLDETSEDYFGPAFYVGEGENKVIWFLSEFMVVNR